MEIPILHSRHTYRDILLCFLISFVVSYHVHSDVVVAYIAAYARHTMYTEYAARVRQASQPHPMAPKLQIYIIYARAGSPLPVLPMWADTYRSVAC